MQNICKIFAKYLQNICNPVCKIFAKYLRKYLFLEIYPLAHKNSHKPGRTLLEPEIVPDPPFIVPKYISAKK